MAVAKTGLGHAPALLQLQREAMEIVEEIGVELLDVAGHDATEEEPAKAGRGEHGEVEPSERNPPSGSDRPRVEDLDLGQDHAVTLPARAIR